MHFNTAKYHTKSCDIHWPGGEVSPGLCAETLFAKEPARLVVVFRQHWPQQEAFFFDTRKQADVLSVMFVVPVDDPHVTIRETVDPQLSKCLMALLHIVRNRLFIYNPFVRLQLRESDFRLLIENFALQIPLELVTPEWGHQRLSIGDAWLEIVPEMDCRARIQIGYQFKDIGGEFTAISLLPENQTPYYARLEEDWSLMTSDGANLETIYGNPYV